MNKTLAIIMVHVVPFGTYAQPRLYLQAFDKTGETPLHRAARLGDTRAISFLLATVPRWLHTESKNGASPLFVAILNGHTAAADLLIQFGASTGCLREDSFWATPFHLMIASNRKTALHTILKTHDRYFPMSINLGDKRGRTPLMIAALLRKVEVVIKLLDTGVDIYAFDSSKRNALFYALQGGSKVVIKHLIKLWDPDFDLHDKTSLHYAILYTIMTRNNSLLPYVIRVTTENGISILAKDEYGKTAIDLAESGENTHAARLLREALSPSPLKINKTHKRTPSMLAQLRATKLISLISSFLRTSEE